MNEREYDAFKMKKARIHISELMLHVEAYLTIQTDFKQEIIDLVAKGKPLAPKDNRFCPECGADVRNDEYCHQCGQRINHYSLWEAQDEEN